MRNANKCEIEHGSQLDAIREQSIGPYRLVCSQASVFLHNFPDCLCVLEFPKLSFQFCAQAASLSSFARAWISSNSSGNWNPTNNSRPRNWRGANSTEENCLWQKDSILLRREDIMANCTFQAHIGAWLQWEQEGSYVCKTLQGSCDLNLLFFFIFYFSPTSSASRHFLAFLFGLRHVTCYWGRKELAERSF